MISFEFHKFVNSKIFYKYFFIHGGGLVVENAIKCNRLEKFNNKKQIKIDPRS